MNEFRALRMKEKMAKINKTNAVQVNNLQIYVDDDEISQQLETISEKLKNELLWQEAQRIV